MKNMQNLTRWWGLGIILGCCFVLDLSKPQVIRSQLENGLIPLLNQVDRPVVKFIEMSKHLFTWPDQIRELILMRQEFGLELAKINQLQALQTENETLRVALGLVQDKQFAHKHPLLAQPLASYAQPMINLGREDGVRTGMLVSSLDGVWLGRIGQVSARVSQVELLTSRQSQPILAQVGDSDQGLVKGRGDHLVFTDVPQFAQLKVGQKVLSVGQPGVPAKELIGVIAAIETLSTDAVQTATIDQLQDFYQVSLVAIYD